LGLILLTKIYNKFNNLLMMVSLFMDYI